MPKKLIINPWDKYNKLTIIKEVEKIWVSRMVIFKCECWKVKKIYLNSVRRWLVKSCWCYNKEISHKRLKTHWMWRTRIYKIWQWMKSRCNVSTLECYKYYGWRWITYNKKWEKFEEFFKDMKEWYSDNLTLDRINNDWNYEKWNCRWATRIQQANNKSNSINKLRGR